ncbi:hypothetical protein A1359_07640 [Methylomonas lenta]|uniref:Uncharacterized protein n=1 Tax=Methylomonas lenta TaxID=980561 RepID=A0A177NF78_9GAMM|nr:hypothetical protein A1359_07640 [Methylomonas lenta]
MYLQLKVKIDIFTKLNLIFHIQQNAIPQVVLLTVLTNINSMTAILAKSMCYRTYNNYYS